MHLKCKLTLHRLHITIYTEIVSKKGAENLGDGAHATNTQFWYLLGSSLEFKCSACSQLTDSLKTSYEQIQSSEEKTLSSMGMSIPPASDSTMHKIEIGSAIADAKCCEWQTKLLPQTRKWCHTQRLNFARKCKSWEKVSSFFLFCDKMLLRWWYAWIMNCMAYVVLVTESLRILRFCCMKSKCLAKKVPVTETLELRHVSR